LQAADLRLHVLDPGLHSADLMHDLLGSLTVAGLSRILQRVLQLSQLLLQPRKLLTKLAELTAVPVVWRRTRGLSTSSWLSGPLPLC
jgi:hypothetical protein